MMEPLLQQVQGITRLFVLAQQRVRFGGRKMGHPQSLSPVGQYHALQFSTLRRIQGPCLGRLYRLAKTRLE